MITKELKSFYKIMKKGVHFLYIFFIQPRLKNEDLARREFILNVLLLGILTLALYASIRLTTDLIRLGDAFPGISPFILYAVFLIFTFLYILSRRGFVFLVSRLFLLIFFLPITFTVLQWGIDLPITLVAYILLIVMSGILINSRFAFLTTSIISLTLIFIGYAHTTGLIEPNLYWKEGVARIEDAYVISALLFVIFIVSWLSNREIEKSLRRARKSEKELQKERDLLEVKVEERTAELKKTQLEKTMQLYRFADFGKMASGLFHDLVNPLTALSLNLEDLKNNPKLSVSELKDRIGCALGGVKNVSVLIEGSRKQIQKQEIQTNFSISYEINLSIQMLSFKARKANVALEFTPPQKDIHTYGNPVKFYRLIHDIVSNAVDSYEGLFQTDKKVIVRFERNGKLAEIQVQDWGCGISKENLGKIFDPLFTTKGHEKGVGIGLMICKEIIEKDFGGKIDVESQEGIGATFTITIPIRTKNEAKATKQKRNPQAS